MKAGPGPNPAPECDLKWNGNDYFKIVEEGNVVCPGQSVTKVGRTTGWTQGMVTLVCENVKDSGKGVYTTILCANQADPKKGGYWSKGGDSGSPVFSCLDDNKPPRPITCDDKDDKSKPKNVRLVGLHFDAHGSFSSIGSFRKGKVKGVQEEEYELGPLKKCAVDGC